MRKIFSILILLVLVSLACNFPGMIQSPARAISQVLITPDPNAAATPTPFMPLAPTPIPVIETPEIAIPTPDESVPEEIVGLEGNVRILILGSDWRPASGFRTDVIMLVVVNPQSGAVSLVSFPRDLYVSIPGIGQQRINTAQQFGGFPLTVQTFQTNFGVTPQYYVMTNFQGFINIIDSLGGIEVDTDRNLTDVCKLPQAVDGKCSVGPGMVSMNGETALWYVRSRYSSSDFDRTRRAQEVITAIFRKLMSLDAVAKAPQLYQQFRSNVETNIPLDVALQLSLIAPGLVTNPDKISRYAIGPNEVWSYVTADGAQVLLPNPDRIQPILYEALNVR